VPAAVMPLPRKNLIGLSMFGGSALPGLLCDKDGNEKHLDAASVMEAIGAYGNKLIDVEDEEECLD